MAEVMNANVEDLGRRLNNDEDSDNKPSNVAIADASMPLRCLSLPSSSHAAASETGTFVRGGMAGTSAVRPGVNTMIESKADQVRVLLHRIETDVEETRSLRLRDDRRHFLMREGGMKGTTEGEEVLEEYMGQGTEDLDMIIPVEMNLIWGVDQVILVIGLMANIWAGLPVAIKGVHLVGTLVLVVLLML